MAGEQQAKVASWMSIAANVFLTVIKVSVGLWAGSEALFADGIHSAIDVVASVAALSALIIAFRPADDEHPYGHGKAEDLVTALVAIVLIVAGGYILSSSVRGFFRSPHSLGPIAIYVAIISLILKEFLYRYTKRLGDLLSNPALKALAQDHRSDIWGSWATVIGVGGALLAFYIHVPVLAYADSVAGFSVGILILRTSYQLGLGAVNALMERNVDLEMLKSYRELVSSVSGIERIDRLRTRNLGHYVVVDVRASVDADKSIQEGHDITRVVRNVIMAAHPEVREVLVHLNPYYQED